MEEIETNGYNLNIFHYVDTSMEEEEINLSEVNAKLIAINERLKSHTDTHNDFLQELGLPLI